MLFGAIEAGGTKMVLAIGNENGEILDRVSMPTETPEITMPKIIAYFKDKNIDALGLGCFGPIDLDKNSDKYGYITSTPKLAWKDYNIVGALKENLNVPIGFDTDVNGAALGESLWGAAKGLNSCIYITVGTGVGVGALAEGNLIHGLVHPEMGHMMLRKHPEDHFEGCCPYHGACVEGLAAGPSLEKRWGVKGAELTNKPEVWEMESYYLAQAVANYILVLSPKKVIMGGGVMKQPVLLPLIREKVLQILNGYVQSDELLNNIDNYIVSPGLIDDAGICGALALGNKAYQEC